MLDTVTLAEFARRNRIQLATAGRYLDKIDPEIIVRINGDGMKGQYVDLHRLRKSAPDYELQARIHELEARLESMQERFNHFRHGIADKVKDIELNATSAKQPGLPGVTF